MKKFIISILAVSMILVASFGAMGAVSAGTSNSIKIIFNGSELIPSIPPVVQDSRVLVPFRSIFEALSFKVDYNSKTKVITANDGTVKMKLTVDQKVAVVNGKTRYLDVAPSIAGSSTLVPIRFVAEEANAKVGYVSSLKIVTVDKAKEVGSINPPIIGNSGFEGAIKGSVMTGSVKYTYPDGSCYVGEIKNGYFHGQGKYTSRNKTSYDGTWDMGKMTGDGKLFYNNGEKIIGTFINGNIKSGSYYYVDGSKYTGSFANYLPNGKGVYTDKNGKVYSGTFKNGNLIL